MKTSVPKKDDIVRNWYLVDANEKSLGRVAAEVAKRLRGKHKAYFTPHMDCGDYIVIINAEKVALTGNKEQDKPYYSHSGYKGGLKTIFASKLRKEKPEMLLWNAVSGMLPANRLKKEMLHRLKIFVGDQHSHNGQSPQALEI